MSSMKSLTNTFTLAIALLAITACVPKATEKKAVCGVNQAFSTVTRSCYSIEELRVKPVGTISTVAMSEETPKTITLTYTDGNKDLATSCKVSSISTNLEMITPSFADGGILDKADEVYQAASNLATALAVSEVNMRDALLSAKASVYYPTIVTQLGTFKAEASAILALGAGNANPAIEYYYNLGQERMLALTPMMTNLSNRCECSGGICTTVAIPKINKSGAAGFTYTVSDLDGESSLKSVSATITAMAASTAHLKPVAQPGYVSLNESSTSVATAYAVTIPEGNDTTGSANLTMRYYFNGSKNGSNQGLTTLGKVSGCMDLTGSTGLTDRSCIYTPDSGNTFDVVTPVKAAVVIDDLNFSAVAEGAASNNYTVQYFDVGDNNLSVDPYVSELETYGMVNSNEAFIRVAGDAVKIFINPGVTTSTHIQSLVNAHPQAKLMLKVTGATGNLPSPSLLTPSAISLAGGVDAFDKIPYYANNIQTSSVNTASLMIKMNSIDDVPAMNYVASAASTSLEDPVVTPILINLSATYSDVDTNATTPGPGYYNTCNVDPTDAIFLANFSVVDCQCVLSVCTASITPNISVSSTTPFTFRYRIGSVDTITATTKYTEYRSYSLTMTPVNDAPEISSTAFPVITAIPAQVIAEGASGSFDVYIGPGGAGFESSQTLTLTAASTNTTLLPNANIVVSELPTPVVGMKRVTYTPAANQSGAATINLTLKDNGGTSNGGVDTLVTPVSLTVNYVDNNPVFISTITSIETNEGGAVQSDGFQVDEDAGSSADENPQGIVITSLTTDNPSVLPTSAIRIFYDLNDNGVEDSGEDRIVTDVLEDNATDDAKLHKFYLKLDPVDGISGNANITLTISDGTNFATTSFSFIVHSVAALHGGWTNISSVGIKTDKLGAPVSSAEIQCNYNKLTDSKKCGSSACTGTISPNSTIVPDAANVIYWDSAALKCYRSTSASQFSWVELNSSCPITRSTGLCSDNNCIVSSSPNGTTTPSAVGLYYFNTSDNSCHVSTGTTLNTQWQTYIPSKVTLAWKQFVMVGAGANSSVQITGWNVYRREAGTDYDFRGGHLKNATSTVNFTIPDPSIRTFTDTTAIAGKVYYYVVRPVDNLRLFPTYTPELFSEVRVLASPTNYSFVHRWIVNQEICNGMNITTTTSPSQIDQTSNFRCEYSGPGQTDISGTMYYDYGRDLLVDSQELGCAYAVAPKCSANGCIGIGAPVSTTGVVADDLYYDRGAGTCYRYTGAVWGAFEGAAISATLANSLRSALNAPLVNVTQAKAVAVCAARPVPTGTGLTFTATNANLPNKKDYNGYASQKLDVTDPEVTEMEQGFSLNIQSRCNGSAASGLETAYTDSSIPSTSFIYSLPGTFSSNIRSLYTGSIPWASSKSTEACVSRFGIQDLYGNVAEWTRDQVTCTVTGGVGGADNFNVCTASTAAGTSFTAADFGADTYSFNGRTGPYEDVDDNGEASIGDGFLTSWAFADELFNAGKFSYPLALPIADRISSDATYNGLDLMDFLLEIGPSSGVTTNKLHEDGIIVNNQSLSGATASFAVGGSYLSGNRAGRFSSELIKAADVRPDVGFRCIVPILNADYPVDTQHVYPY